ncbi:hypothetical protein JWG42_03090 [Desulfoprunum benzoelyticum]|uniref:Uncharacterized protein n=1 Tax=Desulfoprunum benzoelyticum TaxID=1506996 RepID=A0A840ULY9_9BACT|nr:hypothetical protein [Desulfoprunum benzoelyticum]MBB5346615.1 hypothetical protein [Desulfoprunum benzoelyticum]MBM9529139.1 hypothetical protein [Desulfoprunum benzoelyticum]
MQELSKSQKARNAIRTFKILADALTLQGAYKPSGKTGEKLAESLKMFSPEIYGSMADPRIVELKGLEYVIDRMPRGIEKCNRIILTAQEDFQDTSFEEIIPLKRRRVSYAVSEKEMCFVITHGQSEIYDILTHITFLTIESQKIFQQISNRVDGTSTEWIELERTIDREAEIKDDELDQALWNLSIILGRTYKETRNTYDYLDGNRRLHNSNSGLFNIVHALGKRMIEEQTLAREELTIYFTPSLQEMIGHHKYASLWASSIKEKLYDLGFQDRPLHVISANMHSVRNIIYGSGMLLANGEPVPDDLYAMVGQLRSQGRKISEYAEKFGYTFHKDSSGSNIDVNIIDTIRIDTATLHPSLHFNLELIKAQQPVLVVMDYAFGTQAFELMDELLCPCQIQDKVISFSIESISVMGKAGILPGKKGDIMLATAHVMEGTPHNYIVNNDLSVGDFDPGVNVYCGPMVTVLGTSLQNRDVLERFHSSSWKAVGLEMEGGHYQRAISAAIIQGHIPMDMKTRYAYYASDNPLQSGQTLASGPMGEEGIVPTYMITKVILHKILNYQE